MSKPKVSVVTGAAHGMGLACAERLAQNGGVLLLADLDASKLQEVARQISGADVYTQACDVSEPASVTALAEKSSELGRLGALVHAAGVSPARSRSAVIPTINLRGSALMHQAFLPLAQEGSVAVFFASQAGYIAADDMTPELHQILEQPLAEDLVAKLQAYQGAETFDGNAYQWSKYGVHRLVQNEAAAWGAQGARILSISPGLISTPMGQSELDKNAYLQTILDHSPIPRAGRPNEIAQVVAFLCSEEASFMTGADVLVDGGSTITMREMLSEYLT